MDGGPASYNDRGKIMGRHPEHMGRHGYPLVSPSNLPFGHQPRRRASTATETSPRSSFPRAGRTRQSDTKKSGSQDLFRLV
jgi:hypothetical protein